MEELNFNNKWQIWFHKNINDWTINGFEKIYSIETIHDFWAYFNNLELLGGINKVPLYIMRNTTIPLWEKNISGGEWSIRLNYESTQQLKSIEEIIINITADILGESFIDNNDKIIGLSISNKFNKYIIIKIWISEDILKNTKLPDYMDKHSIVYTAYENKVKKVKNI